MLYLGIDQHARQLTVCVRDEAGSVLLRRQVSTRPEVITAFFEDICQQAALVGGWMVMLEVCSFNHWLLKYLEQLDCDEVVLVQPEKQSRRKTDRRDAAALSELLWINRFRVTTGERVPGVRRVLIPNNQDAQNRQLTSLRQRLGRQRTRIINQIKRIVNKHNLIHQQPTKGFQTKGVRLWLRAIELNDIDRLEMDLLLAQWELIEPQLVEVEALINAQAEKDPTALLLGTMTGRARYTALALASRIGPIDRFPSARALTNYWGLTPTCHSSGESSRQGHITKEGSPIVRFLLGQLVLHMLKRDPGLKAWYEQVKKRRGAKIARVGVMRKLAASIWHMVRYQEGYIPVDARVRSNRERSVRESSPPRPGEGVPVRPRGTSLAPRHHINLSR